MKKILPLSIATLALAFPLGVSAQETIMVQNAKVLTSVQDIVKGSVDDQKVRLEGHLIEKLPTDERYTFKDATGTITVEIDDDLIGENRANDDTKLVLTGEVDIEDGRVVEVDVESISVSK